MEIIKGNYSSGLTSLSSVVLILKRSSKSAHQIKTKRTSINELKLMRDPIRIELKSNRKKSFFEGAKSA